MKIFASLACLFLFVAASSCQSLPVDVGSAFARSAGQSTLMVGSTCSKPLEMGFSSCQLERGKPLPTLQIAMMNPGEYAVSDCRLNLWKTGATDSPKLIELDLSSLTPQVEQDGFCLLKIETVERYPDNKDKSQLHEVPISGGFFIEVLEPGYNPVPEPSLVAWCYMVGRTTKGRTVYKQMDRDSCK